MVFSPKVSKFFEKYPSKTTFLGIVILLLVIDKFFVHMVLFNKSKERLFNESKSIQYLPFSLLASLMIVCLVIIMSIKDSVVITTPIVLTMFIMTTFEFMFVQLINTLTQNNIYNKGQSLYKQKQALYNKKPNDYHPSEEGLFKFAQICSSFETPTHSFIKRLNQANFSFLYGLLLCLVTIHILKISKYPKKIVYETVFSTLLSTIGILFLFIFYYVNISSKYPLEPSIEVKGFKDFKSSDKFQKNTNKKNLSHTSVMKRYDAPLEFCADVCLGSDNCTSFQYSQKDKQCSLNTNKEHNLVDDQNTDVYIKL
tara:strand:- start:745 stop:1680 length:936 start_codon:yes stop_codon:yes gene_type:complete